MNPRRDIEVSGEAIDPIVLAEAEAESRMVRLPAVQRRLSIAGQAIAVVVIAGVIFAMFKGTMYLKANRGVAWMVFPALVVVVAGVGWVHAMTTHRRRTRRFRTALIKRGVPVCIECGYSLHGRDPSTVNCPECGGLIQQRDTGS